MPNAPAASKPGAAKALTNAQVIAMVKAGVDDDTVTQAIRTAKVVSFDLTAEGQKAVADGGASATVLAAMKARATPAHATTHTPTHSAVTRPTVGNSAPK